MKDEQDRARGAGNDPRAHAQMGYLLRQVYGTVITEPVPDRFSALLEKLADKTQVEQIQEPAAEQQSSSAKEA